MNCRDFVDRINDVARGALMDAAARAEALAHGAACEACASRLADDRALSAGLRALAARDAGLGAPPRVEAALLAAFRERRAASTDFAAAVASPAAVATASATTAAVASLGEARALRRWTWTNTLATAATAAAAAAAFIMITGPGDAPPAPVGRTVAEVGRPAAASQAAQPVVAAPAVAVASEGTGGGTVDAAGDAGGELAALSAGRAPRSLPAVQAAPRANVPGRAFMTPARYERGGGAARPQAAAAAEARGEEYATDFIPLYQADQGGPVVTGQLVRVELPRSALSRFGLPVSAEGGTGRVKADLLLGEDGMARAIRFVR